MSPGLTRSRTIVSRSAAVGAWIFAVGSLVPLLVFIAWPADHATFASTTVAERTYHALGLTYAGSIGRLWLWSQAIIVSWAIVCSLLPPDRLRRIGLVILVVWSGLWLGNAIWLPMLDGAWILTLILGALLGTLFLCTLIRAARGWPSRAAVTGKGWAASSLP